MLSDIATFASQSILQVFGFAPGEAPGLSRESVLSFLILPLASYVLYACAGRVRYGTGTAISWAWAALYLNVAACAVLLMLNALAGEARAVDVLLAFTVAVYIQVTAPAWRHGVPPVARPQPGGCNPSKEHP